MSTVIYKGTKFQYGETALDGHGMGPYPHAVFMPHVELKKLRADLRRWAGAWSLHSAWAQDESNLAAYLMVAFATLADKQRFEAELAQPAVTG